MASFSSGFSARIMPPKRRAASAAKAGGKKVKQEPETPAPKDAFTSTKEALLAAGSQVKCNRKVDDQCSVSGEVNQIIYTFHLTQNAKCKLLLIKTYIIFFTRYTMTMTACSIRLTSGITITSFMSIN